ncbi:Cnl2/NKP2 family protein-domain-containing protein [Parachaetomium inaequale]|uniref:Cnl2/NKP2 family protein-domain-containing protein n=1 Tax=Parachaetomium inaequale TaxID=2588326 RepID=A0AAN6PEH8_9PEZI|nr:Cnl2/NKP2 family protein-domain-containing protein [Parachaetomium inaequale]
MAPTEQKILSNYLLVPAQLPAILSLQEFIALFPRPLQSSPKIRSLYRDLQSQRNAVVDGVAEQIEQEAKHGKAMRRAVIRSKREAEAQELDDEVEIERMLGNWSEPQKPKYSLASILPDMEGAIGALEAELQLLEEEEASLLASVRQTVGAMSDLRYGRLANSQLPEQVLDGLGNLEEICRTKN